MTYQEILKKIAELNCGDNYKLVGFILEHYVEVLKVEPNRILCNTPFCRDGKSFFEAEWVNASMIDVRNYLGY